MGNRLSWYWMLLAVISLLLVITAAPLAHADEPRWSVGRSTATQLPQDIWISGNGNNATGWRGGGSVCLGVLAQGFPDGQHATLLTDVVEGGVLGIDGTPVEPG